MPTVFTHPAVPIGLGLGLGRQTISRRLLLAGIAGSVLPDLDVIAFRFGIPYATEFGHRGFSHSLLFAAAVALMAACGWRWLQSGFIHAFFFLFASIASHSMLDAFTNGGMGIEFFWPWDKTRYFAPVKEIEVSPLGLGRFFSVRGALVLKSELLWVWLPALGLGALAAGLRRLCRRRQPD